MRSKVGVVLLLVAAGCGAPKDDDARVIPASAALQAHGVAALQARATASGQQVLLRDGAGEIVGTLALAEAQAASTVTLDFRGDHWSQTIAAAEGEMTLALDGRQATLRWDGRAWIGDADGQSLLAASQPFVALVALVGREAGLGVAVAVGAPAAGPGASDGPADTPSPGPTGPPPPPSSALCCGDVVTTGSGWAWYWEKDAQAMACKRATDTLQAGCNAAGGHDCCDLPEQGCTACVDWGTGWACSTAGYLQYVCK